MLRLDVGCGLSLREGFLGVDVKPFHTVSFLMDASKLDFASGVVDEVFSRRCVQHVVDDFGALKEIFRVLKDGGRFTLVVASWVGWLFYRLGLSGSRGNYAVFHRYNEFNLMDMLRRVGFVVVYTERVRNKWLFGYDLAFYCEKVGSI